MKLTRFARLLACSIAMLLMFSTCHELQPRAQAPSVSPQLQFLKQAVGAEFNGKELYRQVFEALRRDDYNLADPEKRAAWSREWEHKFDTTGELDTEAGADAACRKLIDSTGHRFNAYLPPASNDAMVQTKRSQFVGVGITMGLRGARGISRRLQARSDLTDEQAAKAFKISARHPLVLTRVITGSPAEAAGLLAGDILVRVDDFTVEGSAVSDVYKVLQGGDGTSVSVTVRRGDVLLTTAIRRSRVVFHPVQTRMLDGVFYIRLDNFVSDLALDEMHQALRDAAVQNARAVIWDVRANGGGRLNFALDMLAMLIPDGTVIELRNRLGDQLAVTRLMLDRDFSYRLKLAVGVDPELSARQRQPLLLDAKTPIVVLIDENSYSASELVASALQFTHRAVLVGANSGGKGVGQTEIELPWNRSARITTFEFLPNSQRIDWIGSIADVKVEPEDDDLMMGLPKFDKQLRVAIETARKLIAKNAARSNEEARAKAKHEQEWHRN